MKITDKLVQRLMEKWWIRLGLEDWRITWEWESDASLNDGLDVESSAYTQRFPAERAAQIHISSERGWEYPGTSSIDNDLERVVLHELSHIYFAPQDAFLHTGDELVTSYLPSAVGKQHWNLMVSAREGYVKSFVELMLRQEKLGGKR